MFDVVVLPGIFAPASVRYAALAAELGGVNVRLAELAVYAEPTPPADYSLEHEVAQIAAVADRAGFARFHLYGHSGGGACALAFAAAHPERLLSLALDEPASDLTADDQADPYWQEIFAARALPADDALAAFLRLQLGAGVSPPPRPAGPPPPWLAVRPRGIAAFTSALAAVRVDPAAYRAFAAPVLFTHGSLSHPRWLAMRARLCSWFPDIRAVRFEGLHHLNTSHQAEPARTARLLRSLWDAGKTS